MTPGTVAETPAYVYWLILIGIAVLSILGTINAFILNSISNKGSRMDKKLDLMQSKEDCKVAQASCRKNLEHSDNLQCEDIRQVWAQFDKHSHTGLPSDSKVTR